MKFKIGDKVLGKYGIGIIIYINPIINGVKKINWYRIEYENDKVTHCHSSDIKIAD